MDGSLSDGTLCHHYPFVNSVTRFRGQQLLWLFVVDKGSYPFLSGRSFFLSLFYLDVTFSTTLGADVEAPSFSFYLRAAADTLTKALCLATSISSKGKKWMLEKHTKRRQ